MGSSNRPSQLWNRLTKKSGKDNLKGDSPPKDTGSPVGQLPSAPFSEAAPNLENIAREDVETRKRTNEAWKNILNNGSDSGSSQTRANPEPVPVATPQPGTERSNSYTRVPPRKVRFEESQNKNPPSASSNSSRIGEIDPAWSGTGFGGGPEVMSTPESTPLPKPEASVPLANDDSGKNPSGPSKYYSKFTIGIDLGTTYSCVGTFRNGQIEIIPNERGDRTTPSCVAFTDNGRLVGAPAKGQIAFNPVNTIFDVKRLIGRRYDDPVLAAEKNRLPFRIRAGKGGSPAIVATFKGVEKVFTPEEISAMVLTKLKNMAISHLGASAAKDMGCVITVPSTFNIYQRQSTKNACAIAGLNVLRIISEPTAAAFAYDLVRKRDPGPEKERLGLIFDLGGGTLGVSLLTFEDGIAEVKNTAGDDHLGGEDFDYRLMCHLAEDFDLKHKTKVMTDPRAVSRLRTASERAKRTLSSSMETSIEIESLYSDMDLRLTVTRQKFEELCTDLFRAVINTLDQIHKGRYGPIQKKDIDHVILVGGSTRIPKIQEIVSQYFDGKELNKSINPDEAATSGAAAFAATITGGDPSLTERLLLDATSMSIRMKGGVKSDPISVGNTPLVHTTTSTYLVRKNTTIPIIKSDIITTEYDDQRSVKVSFYEGENPILEDNLLLAELELNDIPPAPKGVPQIEVSADLSHDYTIAFTMTEKVAGLKVSTIVDRAINPLTDEDIRRMKREAESMNYQDKLDAERFILKNTLESTAYSVQETFNNLKLIGSISSWHEEQMVSGVEKILSWLELNQHARSSEYRTKLEQLEVFSSLASRLTDESLTTTQLDNDASRPSASKPRNIDSNPTAVPDGPTSTRLDKDASTPITNTPIVPMNTASIPESASTISVDSEQTKENCDLKIPVTERLVYDDVNGILRCPRCMAKYEGGSTCANCDLFIEEPNDFNDMDGDEVDVSEDDVPVAELVSETPASSTKPNPELSDFIEPKIDTNHLEEETVRPVKTQERLEMRIPSFGDANSAEKQTISPKSHNLDFGNLSINSEQMSKSSLSIDNGLSNFFPEVASQEPRSFSDQDLQDIAVLLRNSGRESWSQVPRIYSVLRKIGELSLLDEFIALGITDFFFPFTILSLPDRLSPTIRAKFIETQPLVFTAALELEKGSNRQHAHFGPGQLLPFEVIARLGKGGYGTVDKVISLLSHREYARKSFRRKKTFSKEKEDIKNFKAELKILKRLRHMHCVELVKSAPTFRCSYCLHVSRLEVTQILNTLL